MILEGRNIVLTGAGRGFGRYLAERLWTEGANLALFCRSHGRGIEWNCDPVVECQTLRSQYIDLGMQGAALTAPLSYTFMEWDHIDGLVNNAATQGSIGSFADVDFNEWDRVMNVNFRSPVFLCHEILPLMIRQQYGKIVNLSGGGATGPRPNFAAYAASKAALVRFSETLAHEVRDHHIDVNCVAPGAMFTDMTREVIGAGVERAGESEYVKSMWLKEHTANGDGEMEAPADLIVYLLSSQSDGISGKLLSAQWDDWRHLPTDREAFFQSDIYTLRRTTKG